MSQFRKKCHKFQKSVTLFQKLPCLKKYKNQTKPYTAPNSIYLGKPKKINDKKSKKMSQFKKKCHDFGKSVTKSKKVSQKPEKLTPLFGDMVSVWQMGDSPALLGFFYSQYAYTHPPIYV